MATATKTWDFTTGTLGWAFHAVGVETGAQNATNGLTVNLHGKSLSVSEGSSTGLRGWVLSDTYANIFGIAAGDTVTGLGAGASDGIDWLCTSFTTGGTTHIAAFLIHDSTGANLAGGVSFTTTTTRATKTLFTESGLSLAGSTTLQLDLESNLSTGSSNSADMTVAYPQLVLTVTYTPAAGGEVIPDLVMAPPR